MLSRLSDQRQAISAAETSKSIHRVESLFGLPQEHAESVEYTEATRRKAEAATDGCEWRSSLCVLLCPFLGCGNSLCLVFLPCLGYVVRERIVRVRGTEQSLDREQDGPDLKRR